MRYFFTPAAIALLLATFVVGCQPNTEPAAEPAADAESADVTTVTFANESCPMMGGEPTPELTRQWEGKTIGFCCEGCPEKWDALSDEEKAAKLAAASSDEAAGGHGDHGDHGDHEHGDHGDHGDHEHGDGEHGDGEPAESPGSGQ